MAEETLDIDLRLHTGQFQGAARGVLGIVRSIGSAVSVVSSVMSSLGIVGGLSGAGLIAFGVSAVKASADMDALHRALTAVAGSSEAAERQLRRLKALADRSPVLDMQSAIRGAVQLQSSGFGENESIGLMSTISNAVARGGGNIEGFQRVLVNLQQIASQGKMTGDELRETAAFIPGFRKALLDAFPNGTEGLSGLEVIRGVRKELEKLPQVGGGIQTVFDNLGSSSKLAISQLGDGLNKLVLPVLEKVTKAIDYLASSGIIKRAGEELAKSFDPKKITDGLIRGLAYTIALIKQIPTIVVNVATMIRTQFDAVSKSIGLVGAVLTAIFLRGTIFRIITGIVALTVAISDLVLAIRAWGLAQVVAEAIMTKGLSTGRTLLMMAAALAAGALIFDQVTGKLKEATAAFGTGIGAGDIAASAAKEYNKIMAFINGGKPGDEQGGPDPKDPELNPTLPILKSIDTNIRDMRDSLRDMILGGGAATRAAFNARNISGWSGGGGSGRGMRKVIEGMEEMMAEQVASLGHGGFLGNASARG